MAEIDRLPLLPDGALDDAQRAAAQRIAAGPRGALYGPFVPLLRSPELMTRLQETGEYLRFGSSLRASVFELCVLLVARQWDQQFEWAFHVPLARAAGVSEAVVEAVAQGRRPDLDDEAAAAAWQVADEVHRTGQVADATFRRAVAALGEAGLVDVLGTLGYYATLAMVMNAACTPAPASEVPALPSRESEPRG